MASRLFGTNDPLNWEITVYKDSASISTQFCKSRSPHRQNKVLNRPCLSESPFRDPKTANYKRFQWCGLKNIEDPFLPARTQIIPMESAALIPPGSVHSGSRQFRNGNQNSTNKNNNGAKKPKIVVALKPPQTKKKNRGKGKGKGKQKQNPNQSQSTKAALPPPGSLLPARPKAPYKFNVMLKMVWLRPQEDEKFWIRGRIEKCEQARVDEVEANGEITSNETVFHVVKCADDGTLYRVQLQQMEQSENLIWL